MNRHYLMAICAAIVLVSYAGSGSGPRTSASFASATAAEASGSAESSGSSSISGLVRLEGQPPKPVTINMSQEPTCVKLHSGPFSYSEVVVGPDNSLGNVVVYVSSGLEGKTFEPPAQPVVIDQKGCMYQPHIVAVQTNQKIQVVNDDPTMHNIHPIPTSNREWNKSQPPTMPPIETSFAREEIAIPVKCNVHPWMRSYIAVFSHPYFSVTGKEGSFLLKNLPPGNYTLTAWHEKYGKSEQKVALGTNDSKKIDFVFKARSY